MSLSDCSPAPSLFLFPQAQLESVCEQLRSTQDILAASQQKVALLGEELASVASIRDRTISDLHKSRLEAAETNIKLADMTLKWKEGKGQWWKEKATLLQSMEVRDASSHTCPGAPSPPSGAFADECHLFCI